MAEKPSTLVATKPIAAVVVNDSKPDEERRRLTRIKRAIRRKTAGGVLQLSAEFQGRALFLRGRCASFYCKQVAQHAAMDHLTGESLVNEIEVDIKPR